MNDKKNGLGIYISKDKNIIIGSFVENNVSGMSIIFKDNVEQICLMEKGKTISSLSQNEKKNLKLHQEYKDLIKFYDSNSADVQKFINI